MAVEDEEDAVDEGRGRREGQEGGPRVPISTQQSNLRWPGSGGYGAHGRTGTQALVVRCVEVGR